MFSTRKVSQSIINVDPISGYSEFPEPGDIKKHLLPIFIDPEEEHLPQEVVKDLREKDYDSLVKDFWMPDRLCKLCYGCEDAFTMYRRKHHCKNDRYLDCFNITCLFQLFLIHVIVV